MVKNNINSSNLNDVYICNTYYHLLITILKIIHKNEFGKNDLILFSDRTNDILINDSMIIDRMKQKNIFKNIIIFDHSKEELEICSHRFQFFKKRKLVKKIAKSNEINFRKYKEIYIFFDISTMGMVINYQHIYYNLLEDGTDCFKNANKGKLRGKWNIRKLVKYVFNIRGLGQSKYIKSIEVNDINDIMLEKNNVIELKKSQLFEGLTKDNKKLLLDIFLSDFDYKKYNNKILLITQPLYSDKYFNTEQEQINMYKYIIEKEKIDNKNVIIKTHPREKIDYKKYFHDADIMDFIFPLEILNFCDDIVFDKIITLSSTSINIFKNYNQKIFLGWEWLEKYKEKIDGGKNEI